MEWTRAALVAVSRAGFSVSDSRDGSLRTRRGAARVGVWEPPCTRVRERLPRARREHRTRPSVFNFLARVGGNTDTSV